MKSKLMVAAVFLCMILTACAANAISDGNTPTTDPSTSTINTTTTTFAITTEPVTTVGSGTTTIEISGTTSAPVTNQTLETTTTNPVTTLKPETTAPVTTSEPVLDKVPNASDVTGRIPASPAVEASWFDDACFVGDSVSLKLKTYCLSGALGKAQFFTVGSYSTVNALRPLSEGGPHPSYQGVTMLTEDCVKASGAKKVYIMLGMNDIVYGVDSTITRYKTLVGRILEKSPDVTIFVQSMTPMASTSNVAGSKLNNTNIKLYNQRLEQMCEEMGWYFVDVASVMYDDSGDYLRNEYCSDLSTMGIHFTSEGCARWVEYLRTHALNFN